MKTTIKYVCYECSEKLKLSGFEVVNEVGRKFCDSCGSNDTHLLVVSGEAYNKATRKLEGGAGMKIIKVDCCPNCPYMHGQINGYRCMYPKKSPQRNLNRNKLNQIPTWCQLEDAPLIHYSTKPTDRGRRKG